MFPFFLSKLLFLYYLLAYLLRSFHTCSSHKFIAIQIFYLNNIWMYEFFRNRPQKVLFRNVNLSNLKNILQKKLRTGPQSAFLEHREFHKFLKFFRSAPAMVVPSWVWCIMYRSAQKNSGYVTGLCINMHTTRSQTARIT